MGGRRLASRLVAVFALVWVLTVAGGPASDRDPASPVIRYVAALNAEDLDSALSAFADNAGAAFADDAGYSGGAGKEFIRARLERDVSVNRRVTITGIQVSGETVSWSWEASEDPYHNVPQISGTDVAVVDNGLVILYSSTVEPEWFRRQQAQLAQAAQAVQATRVVSSGPPPRPPDTQQRGTPPTVPWPVTVVVLLGATAALAALKRPV